MKILRRATILACLATLVPHFAFAQVSAGNISQPFTITGVAVGPTLVLNGQATCAVTLSNAGTGLTLVPQVSSDNGATWVATTVIGGGIISAVGVYVGSIASTGLTNFRVTVTALSSGTVSGTETCSPGNPSGSVGSAGTSLPIACDLSVAINISSATTTQLVAPSGTKSVYVCAFSFTVSGTTPTAQFEYGTGASCGSGTTALTGPYTPIVGNEIAAGAGMGTIMRAPAANGVCLVTTGTTPGAQGVLTYAQF